MIACLTTNAYLPARFEQKKRAAPITWNRPYLIKPKFIIIYNSVETMWEKEGGGERGGESVRRPGA